MTLVDKKFIRECFFLFFFIILSLLTCLLIDKDAEITHDLVTKKLMEIVAARGKKKTNRKEQIELLNELFEIRLDTLYLLGYLCSNSSAQDLLGWRGMARLVSR